jgi:hypothetical protein
MALLTVVPSTCPRFFENASDPVIKDSGHRGVFDSDDERHGGPVRGRGARRSTDDDRNLYASSIMQLCRSAMETSTRTIWLVSDPDRNVRQDRCMSPASSTATRGCPIMRGAGGYSWPALSWSICRECASIQPLTTSTHTGKAKVTHMLMSVIISSATATR